MLLKEEETKNSSSYLKLKVNIVYNGTPSGHSKYVSVAFLQDAEQL